MGIKCEVAEKIGSILLICFKQGRYLPSQPIQRRNEMRTELKFVELHTPLFLAGTNFGLKLQTATRLIQMVYDSDVEDVYIVFKDEVAIVPKSNVASMTPKDSKTFLKDHTFDKMEVMQEIKTTVPRSPGRPKAQVSTPTSHVFEQPK